MHKGTLRVREDKGQCIMFKLQSIAVVLSIKEEKSVPCRDFSCFSLQHSVILFTELKYKLTNKP